MEITPYWIRHYGYWRIFSSLLLGIVGVPIPDEWLLTFAGYLVYKGHLQFLPTLASAFLGSVCGITLSYSFGRTAGSYVIGKYGHTVHLTAEKINQVSCRIPGSSVV
jgi:membrane protein DedA with SNARE-associated domain